MPQMHRQARPRQQEKTDIRIHCPLVLSSPVCLMSCWSSLTTVGADLKHYHRTEYMRQIDRNRIRRLMLAGKSIPQIAEEVNMSNENVERYIKAIKQRDQQALAEQDEGDRASAIQSAKESLEHLHKTMLDIVNDPEAERRDKISAAAQARQFETDLVNLALNGPTALGIGGINRLNVIKAGLSNRTSQETEDLTTGTDSTATATDSATTEPDDSRII